MLKTHFPELPEFITADVDDLQAIENTPLRKVSRPFGFPLSPSDKLKLQMLDMKYDSATNIVGLALPQIGINKRGFIMEIAENYEHQGTFPKTLLLNPSFETLDDSVDEDYESCFSVRDAVAKVSRPYRIQFSAYDIDGNELAGTATGIAARVFQHEADHLDGKLFIDNVPREKIMTVKEFELLCGETEAVTG